MVFGKDFHFSISDIIVCLILEACCSISEVNALPSQNFQVSAAVVPGCVIQGNGSGAWGTLDFGTHSAIDSVDVTSSLVQNAAFQLICTPGITLNMTINGGSHYANSRNLKLAGQAQTISYRLFSQPGLTAVSEIPVDQSVSINYGNSGNILLSVYGLLQLTGINRAGVYTDTLTVTMAW